MTPRDDASASPPPRGAGAGGGGRTDAPLPDAQPRKLGRGWSPDPQAAARQKDRTRTNLRAKALHQEMTPSEKVLWKLLRTIEGAHFRKQVAVGDFVFDFGWLTAGLLIEVDGSVHERADVQECDEAKEIFAITQGFRVMRFQNNDAWDRPAWVVAQVRGALKNSALDRPPPLAPPHKGAGDEEQNA